MAEAALWPARRVREPGGAARGGAGARARAGYRRLDAFTPFPVEGLARGAAVARPRVLWLGMIGALLGAAVALRMQVFTNCDYPLNVGGRPLYALSAFAVVIFELTVLFAALSTVFGMLARTGCRA